MTILQAKYTESLAECKKHQLRLGEASEDLRSFMPLTGESYAHLSKEPIRVLDQYIFRFTKLQDTMGHRLFKDTLALLGEDCSALPYIDLLMRLEKLGLIKSTDQWLTLRQIRNELAHEYEDVVDLLVHDINTVYQAGSTLVEILATIESYMASRLAK